MFVKISDLYLQDIYSTGLVYPADYVTQPFLLLYVSLI